MTCTDPIHVLHVDDEPTFADTAAAFLGRENDQISVRTATGVSKGLEVLEEYDIDCVVSDYEMPEKNGIEFLNTVREQYPDIPFILFTGKGSEEVASEAISAGVTEYLQKEAGTGQYTVLANRITNAVEQYRSQQELEASQNRLSLFIEQSPLGVLEYNSDFEIVRVNNAGEEILGYSEEELCGETWEKIVASGSYNDVDEVTSALSQAEGGYHSIDKNVRSDGEHIVCEWHNRVVTDSDGDVVAIFSLFQDITERKEREKRLEALFENSPDMIDIHTSDGTIIDTNKQFSTVLDQSKDDLIGQKVWEIDSEISPDRSRELWDSMDVGDRLELETTFQRPDGEEFPVEVHLTRLSVPNDDQFMVISRDITERKDRMKEIQNLKERFELAVQGANLGVWDWDMSTDAVEFNKRWAEMLGYTLDDIEPHLDAWEKRVHPDDLGDVNAALEAHINGETEYYDTEHRMKTADCDWKWIRDIGKIVERDDENEPVRAVGIHLDINDRKQREKELEQKTKKLQTVTSQLEDQYRTLFEEAPVMAIITRSEQQGPVITDCNRQFAETLGYDSDTIVGTELGDFYTPESRDRLLEEGGYERALSGEFTKERRKFVTANGETVETLLRAVPHQDASGNDIGTLAMYVDITEREQIKQANERLQEFTRIVSHDLRNPLTVADGRLELAREECDSEHLDAIAQAHDRMHTLITDLLTLAREGDQLGDIEAVDFDELVRTCWENVATARADMQIAIDKTIKADRTRLQQLVENLIRNAVEHAGENVTVTVGELDSRGFYVEDDGIGIHPDDRDEVFDAGYSASEEGTGFGLSIVEQIVEAHNWEIRVTESDEGGVRFEMTGVEFIDE